MNRRTFLCGLGSVVADLPGVCSAQSLQGRAHWAPWRKIPSIVVISDRYDSRLQAVQRAVGFWNDVFLNLGSPFRLGQAAHIAEAVPVDQIRWDAHRGLDQLLRLFDFGPAGDARRYSDQLFDAGIFHFLAHVSKLSGDVIVALSNGKHSFTVGSRSPGKVLVVIEDLRTYQTNPPTTPTLRGLQDTIAHELGHVIGLEHNNDGRSLMCGPCIPRAREDFSLLTESEKILLLKMYPPSWRAEPW